MNKNNKKTILLVEDEALIAMAETKMLEKHGYAVVTANSGEKAVAAVDSNPEIALILMDIDLGTGIDGPEAADRILKTHDLPLAFLSSHTEPEVVEKTEGITSYGYIVKNSGETVLLASVRMAFRLYDAHMELKKQKEDLNTALRKYEQTAEELAEKNEELDRYFSSSLDLLCIANTAGDFVRLNPEWEKVLGYSVAEMKGRSFFDFVHSDDQTATREAIAQLDTGKDVISFENRLCSKDGGYRWIEWRSRPIGSELYAAARDVTERKRAEYETRKQAENLRITLNSIGDAVISTDSDGAVSRMNPVAETMCGWRIDEAKGKPLTEVFHIVHAETGETVENPVARVLETGNVIGLANHTTLISRDGTEYQIADSAAPIRDDTGHTTGVVLVFRDVTEEYRVAQALATNERDMARAQALAQLGSWRFDLDSGSVTGSDQARRIYGVDKDGLTMEYVQLLPLPEYRPTLDAALKALVQEGTPYDVEFKIHRPSDNTVRSIHSVAEYDAEHNRIVGTLQDITERRLFEEKLRVKSSFIDRIAEVSPDIFIIYKRDGEYLDIITANQDNLFLKREELLGSKIPEVLPETAAATIMHGIDDALTTNSLKVVEYKLGIDNDILDFESRIIPLEEDRVLAQIIDITERKQLEDLLKKSEERFRTLFYNSEVSLWEEEFSEVRKMIDVLKNEGVRDFYHYFDNNPDVVWDLAKKINVVDINDATLRLYGAKSKKEIIGSLDRTLYLTDDNYNMLRDEFVAVAEGRTSVKGEMKTRTLYGEVRDITMGVYISKEKDIKVVAINDITAYKNAVKEKDFLMKELNHRVKNGLAMVSSLISLKDSETEIDLSDIQHQIEAIGLIHEKLYQTERVTEICLRDYIADLLSSIFSTFTTRPVKIETNIDDTCVFTKTAMSLGLIVNEIATNAIKHGFTDGEEAVFSVRMETDEENSRYELSLSNNGNPFPEEISIDNPDTLGLRLMSALVDQIDGTLELQKKPHPVFTIRFPVGE